MSAKLSNLYVDKLNKIAKLNYPGDAKRLAAMKEIFDNTKNLATLSDKLLKLQMLVDECPELQKQLDDMLKELDKELNQKDVKEKTTNSVTSLDPNEITGPAGQGFNRYVNNVDRHRFVISFENVDSAKASAQIVIVRDTLDKTKYNLSTFEFGGISIGKKYFRLPKARKQFVIERSVPGSPVKVRMNGSIDTTTGVIEWQFTSIDSITNNFPVFDGFLPPNVTKPDGEGSVSFSVNPISSLTDGTVFRNKASIIFDRNAPIQTNTWINTLDIGRPASTLIANVTNDSIIHLSFNGQDAVSGVGYYNLHVAVNAGPWHSYSGTNNDTMSLTGSIDSTYKFYVTSEDVVGNKEQKAPNAEATVTLKNTLAVTLGDISATNEGTRNRISWNTLHEDYGDSFEVEKSNNTRDFMKLQTVAARGVASSYTIYDNKPSEGRNYYRLKTVDISGSVKTSKIVSAFHLNNNQFALEAFPNPLRDLINIDIHGTITGKANISIANTMGNIIYKANVNRNRMVADLSKQPAGTFIIKYVANNKTEVIKVTKL